MIETIWKMNCEGYCVRTERHVDLHAKFYSGAFQMGSESYTKSRACLRSETTLNNLLANTGLSKFPAFHAKAKAL